MAFLPAGATSLFQPTQVFRGDPGATSTWRLISRIVKAVAGGGGHMGDPVISLDPCLVHCLVRHDNREETPIFVQPFSLGLCAVSIDSVDNSSREKL